MNSFVKLQHIAAVKIATTLWVQDDIKNVMIKNGFYKFRRTKRTPYDFELKEIVYDYEAQKKVCVKVRKLLLPELIKKKIFAVVKSIHFEIMHWEHLCGRFLPLPFLKKAFNHLSWTPEGTINEKKIAEVLIKDDKLDIIGRYELACIYCLESDVKGLWDKLSEIQREFLLDNYTIHCNSYASKLVLHWTSCMKNAFDNNKETIECTTWKDAFECAVDECNLAATEYTLQKLTLEERKSFVIMQAQSVSNLFRFSNDNHKRYHSKILRFLVSQMCEKQQMEIFETYSYVFLKSLLDWPMENLFLDTAERLWDFLPLDKCMMLYEDIIDKSFPDEYYYEELLFGTVSIKIFSDINYYDKLFKDFWQQSPAIYKKHFFNNYTSKFLIKLFKLKDLNSIKCILNAASTEEKSKIILCDRGQYICSYLLEHNKWKYLTFFILKCIPSTNDIQKLEANLENLLSRRYRPYADEMLNLKRFFKLFKDICKVD